MTKLPPTVDMKFRRHPERGSTDLDLAHAILDEGLLCHVGFELEGQPYIIPMGYGRMDSKIILHGSIASRLMKHLASSAPCCVSVTLLDGLVLARSQFSHSMNFRSLTAYGSCERIQDPDAKKIALERIVDHLIAGRTADARASNRKELAATEVLSLSLDQFTVKCRSGEPIDKKVDEKLRIWAGVIPLSQHAGAPQTDSLTHESCVVPEYAREYAEFNDR